MLDTTLRRLMEAVETVLPQEMAADARTNLKSAHTGALDRMDLVTREEFETQQGVLLKTRSRLKALEARLQELENKHNH